MICGQIRPGVSRAQRGLALREGHERRVGNPIYLRGKCTWRALRKAKRIIARGQRRPSTKYSVEITGWFW